MKIYQVIRANGGWENWTMVMIEPFPCENRLQAERRERYWYEELSASLNSQYPSRTKTEYYNDNKQQITEQRKQYYEANKQQIAEQIKQYYEANKQHIAEQKKQYYQKNKEQKKQYYQKNKEQIAEYQLAYRLKKKTETKGDAL